MSRVDGAHGPAARGRGLGAPHCQEFGAWEAPRHMELVPQLTRPAGFELGSGLSINTVLPESAAQCLRDAKVD